MDCRNITELLHDFARKRLEPSLQHQVAGHLKQCAACSEELRRIRRYFDIIEREDTARPPADFIDQTMKRIRREPSPMRRLFRTILLPAGTRIPLGAAGLALASVVTIFLLRPSMLFHDQTPPTAPENVTILDTAKEPRLPIQRISRTRTDSLPPAESGRAIDALLATADGFSARDEESDASNEQKISAADTMVIALNVHAMPSRDEMAAQEKESEESLREYRSSQPSATLGGSMSVNPPAPQRHKAPGIGTIISSQQGKIAVSRQAERGTFYRIILPRKQYGAFIRELEKIGQLKATTGETHRPGETGTIDLDLMLKGAE